MACRWESVDYSKPFFQIWNQVALGFHVYFWFNHQESHEITGDPERLHIIVTIKWQRINSVYMNYKSLIPGLPRCDDAIIWSSNQHELLDAQKVFPPCWRGVTEKCMTVQSYCIHPQAHNGHKCISFHYTCHVFVRSVTVEHRQEAVPLQIEGPMVRICGGKMNIYIYICYLFKGEGGM